MTKQIAKIITGQMPSHFKSTISYGSDDVARKRKALYEQAAKRLENGNFSRMVMIFVDKALGIHLPLPALGRPKRKKK